MLTFAIIGPRAVKVTAGGRIDAADIAPLFDSLDGLLANLAHVDLLVDAQGELGYDPRVLLAEAKRWKSVLALLRALERVAVVADAAWIRAVSRVESAVIPGLSIEVYDRAGADRARAWITRESDTP